MLCKDWSDVGNGLSIGNGKIDANSLAGLLKGLVGVHPLSKGYLPPLWKHVSQTKRHDKYPGWKHFKSPLFVLGTFYDGIK